jgi:hypothetical protein
MRDNWLYVAAAYVITWGVILVYLVRLIRLVRRAGNSLVEAGAMTKERIP